MFKQNSFRNYTKKWITFIFVIITFADFGRIIIIQDIFSKPYRKSTYIVQKKKKKIIHLTGDCTELTGIMTHIMTMGPIPFPIYVVVHKIAIYTAQTPWDRLRHYSFWRFTCARAVHSVYSFLALTGH